MTTRNNPYDGLIGLFHGAPKDDLALYDGIVVSTSPLRISAAGLELDAEDLANADNLSLAQGSAVALFTRDNQLFYLIPSQSSDGETGAISNAEIDELFV